jgi:hypothetical protein
VAAFITSTATPNRLVNLGTGSPNLLLYSMGTGGVVAPAPQPTLTVSFKSITGSATRSGGNWRAYAIVTVRDVNSGAPIANATATGSFLPGGAGSCVTGSNGRCTLGSSPIKNNASASSTLTATGVSGTLMIYDASQNAVSQIVIAKP